MSDADDENSEDELLIEYTVNVVIHWMDSYSPEMQLYLKNIAAFYLQRVWKDRRVKSEERRERKKQIMRQWYSTGMARV